MLKRIEVKNKVLKAYLEEKLQNNQIVDKVLKEAFNKNSDLINDLGRILKLNVDEKFIQNGMKLISILDKLKSPSILERNQINIIKDKIKSAMELIQESQEELFNLQQSLINEKGISSES